MRVMLVTNGLRFGGAERIVQALAVDVAAAGHEVMVVATTRGGPIGEALRGHGLPVEILGLRSVVDVRVPLQLRRLIHRFRPDVVHSHLAVADIASTAAAAPGRVCTVHNPGVELQAVKRWLWRRALPRFERVVAVSDAVRRSLPVAAEVIRPSLVTDAPPRLSRAEARRRLQLTADEPVIMAVGRLHPIKGFDVLARAAELVTAPVLVIGDGPQAPALRGSRLRLLGARDDAADLMAAADAIVMPSRSEGFPQVPLHAMAAGIAVVGTQVGGTPEIVVDGETGLLVPPEDPRALAAALRRVLSDPQWARQLGAAGRRRLSQANFTRGAMVSATVSLYRQVTNK